MIEVLKRLTKAGRIRILDVPAAVLTPEESRRPFTMRGRPKRRGLGIVLMSHEVVEVMQSDRVTVLRRGCKVVTVATADTDPDALTRMMIGARPTPAGHAGTARGGRGGSGARAASGRSRRGKPRGHRDALEGCSAVDGADTAADAVSRLTFPPQTGPNLACPPDRAKGDDG